MSDQVATAPSLGAHHRSVTLTSKMGRVDKHAVMRLLLILSWHPHRCIPLETVMASPVVRPTGRFAHYSESVTIDVIKDLIGENVCMYPCLLLYVHILSSIGCLIIKESRGPV